jgi:predicted Zn-dependent protease
MAKKMKKRLFKKKVSILHEQYYELANQLPTVEDMDEAEKWMENLIANNAPKSVSFDVVYDKIDEMHDKIIKARES